MKISVVTNAFNQGAFLGRCLDSVLGQPPGHPHPEIEHIVIDPGSTDETPAILTEYARRGDPRLTILRGPDDGPADGLNRGFARASGDWFHFLNADDFLLPGALGIAARAIAAHPEADCLHGDGVLTDRHGQVTRRVISTPFSARRYVAGRTEILQQATFYKAASFRRIGGFNAANRTCWDGEILLDFALAGMRVQRFAGYVGAFAIHPDSISGSGRLVAAFRQDMARMHAKALGYPPRAGALRMRAAWVLDRLTQPRRSAIRLRDHVLGPPPGAPVAPGG